MIGVCFLLFNPANVFCTHCQSRQALLFIGRIFSPSCVKEYSTRRGISGKTSRLISPSSSICLKFSVSTLALIPSIPNCKYLNLYRPFNSSRRIRGFHLFPIKYTVVATGQAGNSSFFNIISSNSLIINSVFLFKIAFILIYFKLFLFNLF